MQKCLHKGPGKRGHIVADTLLPMLFLGLRKLRNICCGHKMLPNKIRNIFCVRKQNLCPQQMLRARANGETFVSATMCPQQCVPVCQGLKKRVELPQDWFGTTTWPPFYQYGCHDVMCIRSIQYCLFSNREGLGTNL